MKTLLGSLRVVAATWLICVAGYGGLILAIGQGVTPRTADGNLLEAPDGRIAGSRQIAQAFSRPGYFWPRLSAVDYDGAAAGGSNLAPTNPAIAERALPAIKALGGTPENPVPVDLITASGSGLDPHITLEAALYQVPRVAAARNRDAEKIAALIDSLAFSPGGFLTETQIVNVLELNLALDQPSSDS